MIDCSAEYLDKTASPTVQLEQGRLTTQAQSLIEIWCINLSSDRAAAVGAKATKSLSASERARAERFRFPQESRNFTASHVALRHILGAKLGCSPEFVRFVKDEQGKPQMAGGRPFFSLTHSRDVALVALSAGTPVGVDVEMVRPLPELEALIEFACTAHEQAELANAADLFARTRLFMAFWTRKEAALKATGRGLRVSPRLIETALGPWVVPDPVGAPDKAVHVSPLNGFLDGAIGAAASLGAAHSLVMKDFAWSRDDVAVAA